jgi:hypothetical protein
MGTTKTIFLDTMIYLHYKAVEEVDWRNVFGVDEVLVVVPRITIRELDKHKDHHESSKIRNRARKRLQIIEKWAEAETTTVRPGVLARVYNKLPTCDFAALHLDRNRADDLLVATIAQYQQDNPTQQVLLITQDTTPRLTARALGLQASGISDEFALRGEIDPVEQENRELRRQLDRMQNAAPKLLFGFAGEERPSALMKASLVRPQSKESWISSEMQKVRQNHRPRRPSAATLGSFAAAVSVLGVIPPEEYDRYNRDLERFFEKYEGYLAKAWSEKLMEGLSIQLCFELLNDGGAPAEEIDFHLHFPDGFTLDQHSEAMFDIAEPPQPPTPPRTQMQMIGESLPSSLGYSGMYDRAILPDFSRLERQRPPNLTPPEIQRGDSYDVRWELRLLKHKQAIGLHSLVAIFGSYEKAASFGVEYRIQAANVLDPLEGTLHVVVEKD